MVHQIVIGEQTLDKVRSTLLLWKVFLNFQTITLELTEY